MLTIITYILLNTSVHSNTSRNALNTSNRWIPEERKTENYNRGPK